jgi:hypothetical protein
MPGRRRFGATIALGSCEVRNTRLLEENIMKPSKTAKKLGSKKLEKKVPLTTLKNLR